MKQVLRTFALAFGILWIAWVAALLYGIVAPRLFGPEQEINALHESISPGISTTEFQALLKPDIELTTSSKDVDNSKLHVSKLTGDWLCTFEIHITDEQVDAVKDIICVD